MDVHSYRERKRGNETEGGGDQTEGGDGMRWGRAGEGSHLESSLV